MAGPYPTEGRKRFSLPEDWPDPDTKNWPSDLVRGKSGKMEDTYKMSPNQLREYFPDLRQKTEEPSESRHH